MSHSLAEKMYKEASKQAENEASDAETNDKKNENNKDDVVDAEFTDK